MVLKIHIEFLMLPYFYILSANKVHFKYPHSKMDIFCPFDFLFSERPVSIGNLFVLILIFMIAWRNFVFDSFKIKANIFMIAWRNFVFYSFKIKANIFVFAEDVFETSSRHLAKTSSRLLQEAFKTFWKHIQDFFKTSSRRLALISSRRFQDVHQVKLFA